MKFKDLPIERKLTTIILLTSGTVLLLSCAAFIAHELVTFRRSMINGLDTMAQVVSANSGAALAFNDPPAGTEILAGLRADPHIRLAALYDSNGKLFAQFPARQATETFPQIPGRDGIRSKEGHLILFYPVIKDDGRLGTLYLKSDLQPLYDRLSLYAGIVAMILTGALLLAFVLSHWLQKSISQPIIRLAETARLVSENKNYLVRADKLGRDELGQLTEAFNHMLAQIHERDLAVMANQERLKLALRASQTGIWDWDIKSNRMNWDDFTHVLFGLRQGAFNGTYEQFVSLIHPQDRADVMHAAEETLRTGREFNVEFQVIWPDGSGHQIASRGKAIMDATGSPMRMTGVCLDVTERKRAEEEIRTLNAELEQRVLLRTAELTASTREMEAFTYSVSHDLRAPLRHMIAFAEILEEEYTPRLDSAGRDYVHRIMLGARSMSQLVDDLLNLARIGRQALSQQTVDLGEIAEEAIADLKTELGGRTVEWRVNRIPEAECDRVLIKQVFVNLLSNAVKYTRPRKIAVIEVGTSYVKGERVIFVRDNGVGFNMEYADKLFGVFQRLHRADEFEGTGVGLATVDRILQKHGGRIWAEAELDKGATFYFTLESLVKGPSESERGLEAGVSFRA
jgi:PAS domain S-box-containing protein